MGSSSGRKYGSSGRSGPRKRVVIGADETVRVRYQKNQPQVEAERRPTSRQTRPGHEKDGRAGSGVQKQARKVSAAKKAERERRQRMMRMRQTALYAGVVALVFACIFGCVALYRAPILPVRSIQVSGTDRLTPAEVEALAKVPADATLIRLPVAQIERRILASPWIGSVKVERDFPDTVRLTVVERTPLAVVDAGGTSLWVVSGQGNWLSPQTPEDEGGVVIRDIEELKPAAGVRTNSPELLNALKVIAGISPELRASVKFVSAPTIDKTALITEDDVEVFIGAATQLAEKDRIVRQILESKKDEVVYINVRVVESPIWRGLDDPQ